ncbi:HD domain-containing protein [Patescibacteria group bacterium]|nr:HD domain-containing protein [Patescibacteria group bacterium]
MIISDKVYGKVEINEPVLIELIKSKPLQRLKGINQGGTQHITPEYKNLTRYKHCVGVMLLLKRYGASTEEQIAGLLHDVPHTAFSHVIDYAIGKADKQTFHEDHKERIILNSEIPKILSKYQYSLKRILNEENFPLLEKEIPDLCADRIDYFFIDLDAVPKGFHTPSYFLKHLIVSDNEFALDSKKVALEFAKDFMKKCLTSWNSLKALTAFSLLSETIKIALDEKLITQDDIFQDDAYLFKKLKKIKNKKIQRNLSLLHPDVKILESDKNFEYHARGKARYVDPKVLVAGKKIRVSTLYPDFKKEIEQFKQKVKAGRKIKVS